MRPGLLTETIGIHQEQTKKSASGAVRKEYVETHRIKAYRKKLSAAVGTGINASEEFIANTIVFQVWRYSFLNERVRVKYGDNFYKVTLLDRQADNSYLMTCTKINE
ncbi:hypothetical protein LJB87_01995 [Alistipes sp. OttesenSCG-928-L06]|nr:hypothetical protein [Alistipes sp. OttesenSCG-928-L06]